MTLELNLTALFVESIVLMTCFIVYGATLVLDLKRYYEKRYSAQRLCIIKQVSVICVAMLFMLVQFVIEFLLCVDGFCNDFYGKFRNAKGLFINDSTLELLHRADTMALLHRPNP